MGLFLLSRPRGAAELSGALEPLPSEAQLARDVGHSLENGVDGQTNRDDAIDAMVKDMMAKKGFVNTGMLVVDTELTGIELQAEAAWEDGVYDHHIEQLNESISAQESVVSWIGLVSPFVAMRSLSAGLSGTDYAHHRHFSDYAEGWRKALVTQLNETFAQNAGTQGWDYRAGSESSGRKPHHSPTRNRAPSLLSKPI